MLCRTWNHRCASSCLAVARFVKSMTSICVIMSLAASVTTSHSRPSKLNTPEHGRARRRVDGSSEWMQRHLKGGTVGSLTTPCPAIEPFLVSTSRKPVVIVMLYLACAVVCMHRARIQQNNLARVIYLRRTACLPHVCVTTSPRLLATLPRGPCSPFSTLCKILLSVLPPKGG